MRRLFLSVALGGSLLAAPALAGEGCACGDEGCEQACTCSAGVCPLHRPGKASPASTSSSSSAASGEVDKAARPEKAPAAKPAGTGSNSAPRAPAAR